MAMLNNKMVKKTKQLSRVMAALKGQSVVKSKSAGHDERDARLCGCSVFQSPGSNQRFRGILVIL